MVPEGFSILPVSPMSKGDALKPILDCGDGGVRPGCPLWFCDRIGDGCDMGGEVVPGCPEGCIIPEGAPIEPGREDGEVAPPGPVDDPPIIPTARVEVAMTTTVDRVHPTKSLDL
jgi:hypothetical protein